MKALPSILLACLASISAAEPVRLAIPNGDMSDGGAAPAGWDAVWTGSGRLEVARDTSVHRSAPASLRVASLGGTANGNATATIAVAGGSDVALTGWVRSEGRVKVNVMAQSFGADWSKGPLGFQQLKYLHDDRDHDWSEWTARFTTPPGTAHVLLGLMIEGEGRAWLDDVRNIADPPFADRPAAAASPAGSGIALASPPDGDPASTPLPPGKPWIPGWCRWDWRAGWLGMHREFAARTRAQAGKIDVVFYGDSITQGWGDGVKALAPQLNVVNYGIGGDSTRQILWRVSKGEIDGISPKLIVLAIGTNNLYDDANGGSDEEVAKGIATCVELLKAKQPQARILISGIMARQNDWFCSRVQRVNALVRKLDNGDDIRYLDTFAAFHDPASPHRVREELFLDAKGKGDWLHIGPKGYVRWGELIRPLLDEMLK